MRRCSNFTRLARSFSITGIDSEESDERSLPPDMVGKHDRSA